MSMDDLIAHADEIHKALSIIYDYFYKNVYQVADFRSRKMDKTLRLFMQLDDALQDLKQELIRRKK